MLRLFLVMLDQISVMESLGMECTRCWCRILKGWEDRRAVWNVSVFVRKRWQGGCWWARARDCTPSRPSSVVAPPTHVVRQALVTWLWGSAYCSYESLHHRTRWTGRRREHCKLNGGWDGEGTDAGGAKQRWWRWDTCKTRMTKWEGAIGKQKENF